MLKCLIIFNKFQRLAGRIGQSDISESGVYIFLFFCIIIDYSVIHLHTKIHFGVCII